MTKYVSNSNLIFNAEEPADIFYVLSLKLTLKSLKQK